MSKIWITRTQPGATETAARLTERGYVPLVAPLMTIEDSATLDADPARYQAVLFTSANAVRAFARLTESRPRALCVGDATRDVAKGVGFTAAESAGSDVRALTALIQETLRPEDGPLLFASGRHVAAPLDRVLRDLGFDADRAVVYSAVAVAEPPPAAQAAIDAGEVSVVLFHSRRAAEIFTLITPPRIARLFRYVAISGYAAEPLFIPCEIAAKPNENALLATLERMTGKRA